MKSNGTAKCGAVLSLLLLVASVSMSTSVRANRVRRSADDNFASLQNVMAQQAAVIQTLQAKVAASENSLRVLQTKVDATSTAVAFSAVMSPERELSEQDGVALTPNQTVVYEHTFSNEGNAYNTHTGVFTAPVAGTYVFFFKVMGTYKHSSVILAMYYNDLFLDEVYSKGYSSHEDGGSSLVSRRMSKGDRMYVRLVLGDHVRGFPWTTFTGFLLQAQ